MRTHTTQSVLLRPLRCLSRVVMTLRVGVKICLRSLTVITATRCILVTRSGRHVVIRRWVVLIVMMNRRFCLVLLRIAVLLVVKFLILLSIWVKLLIPLTRRQLLRYHRSTLIRTKASIVLLRSSGRIGYSASGWIRIWVRLLFLPRKTVVSTLTVLLKVFI